jgi:hypothetical protein
VQSLKLRNHLTQVLVKEKAMTDCQDSSKMKTLLKAKGKCLTTLKPLGGNYFGQILNSKFRKPLPKAEKSGAF